MIKIIKNNKLFKLMIPGMFLLVFLMALSLVGYTNAWFTDGDQTSNIFTTGTLSIDIEGPDASSIGQLDPDSCSTLNYTITNEGSKRVYVRAWFNGFWQQTYHKNTATVKAKYDGQWYYASDSAYYFYNHDLPEQFPGGMPPGPSYGFNDIKYVPPVVFPALQLITTASVSSLGDEIFVAEELNAGLNELVLEKLTYSNLYYSSADQYAVLLNTEQNITDPESSGSDEEEDPEIIQDGEDDLLSGDGSKNDGESDLSEMMVMASAYEPTDKGVIPVFINPMVPPAGIPLEEAAKPDNCAELSYSKFEGNPVSGIYKDGDFSVTLTVVGGNISFSDSTHPIMHVFVKGGGGNNGLVYNYYNPDGTPHFSTGVYSDSGLYTYQGGLSHITFIYCEPPAKPAITLKKYVSVDGGTSWFDADTLAEAPTAQGIAPQFKFVVTNTGNVDLENVLVTDDQFGQIDEIIPLLEAGGSHTFFYTDDDWLIMESLSTDNVKISLCESGDPNWSPAGPQSLGTYFYYDAIIYPEGSGVYEIPLCINICLDASQTDAKYDGAKFILYSAFEAVQVTNNMAELNWGYSPPED